MFNYNAHTVAIGGQIEENDSKRALPSAASVTLAPDGGFGESCVTDYCEDGISIYRAESRVYGSAFKDRFTGKTRLFKTFANVTIYGLDLKGIVQADVVSASITSINERVNDCPGESRISFDASIVGLVINGHPYDVELDTKPFRDYGTFSSFTESFTKMNADQVQAAANAYNWKFADCQTGDRFHVPKQCQNGLRATVLSNIKSAVTGDQAELNRAGYTIEVPGLGLLHLGEVLVLVGKRSINTMRIEPGKSLADLMEQPIDVPAPTMQRTEGEQRFALAAAKSGGTSGGGYTVANVSGNGTDFGPPP
jgi:hypothetical protein